jgi:radical SAM protein with 4Fe4S-binding SPASM domain
MTFQSNLEYLNRRFYSRHIFSPPSWIALGVNNSCNLHCKMCDVGVDYQESNFYQNLMGAKPVHMPIELFKKIADQAATYYPNVKLGYAFTEPLVYKHLAESLQYAASKKLHTSITTNALNLRKMADNLIDGKLKELFVSLDGPADIHNEIRGYKLSFEKAVEGIDYLLQQNERPEISIFCVITQWNIGRLKEFIDYFKNHSLTRIGFMHTNFTPETVAEAHNLIYGGKYQATSSNMQDINMQDYNLNLLYEEINEIKKTNYPFPISFSPDISTKELLQQFYHHPEKLMGKRCHDVFNNIMIKSNGDVIPAHGRCYNIVLGNLYNETLTEVWNSKEIAEFRKDLNKAGGLLPACSRCCSAFN